MKYIYPAIFTKEGEQYTVSFNDIPNCFTQGENLQDAMEMAQDALCLTLYHMEQEGKIIPKATDITSVVAPEKSFVTLVCCDTIEYEKFYKSRAIKKTLTIPEWLNDMALNENINFSNVLQNALMEQLNIANK